MRKLIGLAVLLAVALPGLADELWDNNLIPNEVGGRPISPPGFPKIRVVDDFVVPDDARWSLENIHYIGAEDNAWRWADGDGITVEIWNDNRGRPGTVIETRSAGGTKTAINRMLFGRELQTYRADFEDDPVVLGPGTYWISVRHPSAGGSGSNYWVTSDGGSDGGSSSTGYVSADKGNSWTPEGTGWHKAFVLTGRVAPEPTTLAMLALCGPAVLRRRHRL